MLNDQQFLDKYVQAAKLLFSSLTKDAVIIKDTEHRFLTLTYRMLELLGVDSAEKIIGKSHEELIDILPLENNLIDEFRNQNQEVIKTKENRVYLEVVPLNGERKIYIAYKTPIINPDTGNCVGIRTQISKMYWPNVLKALFKLHGAKGLLLGKKNTEDPLEAYPLSEMQHMVLYLCLSNYSYSEIALLISEFGHEITPIRVNDYLEQLKLIFHVKTKSQLVEKAIGLGFHTYLPNGLFSSVSSIDITEESAEIITISQ